jgi:uncharacterized protein (TIGR02996 family)
MSATLLQRIGMTLWHEGGLVHWANEHKIKYKRTLVWAGVRQPRWECMQFSLKLPRDVCAMWHLIGSVAMADGFKLRDKLIASLGLPMGPWHKLLAVNVKLVAYHPDFPDDLPFLREIANDPSNLDSWAIYADWLEEHAEDQWRLRGQLIRGWLGKKAIKVKYGMPMIARKLMGLSV